MVKRVECYKYHENGHYNRDCPLRNKKGKEKRKNSLKLTNVITNSLNKELLVVFSSNDIFFTNWTVDFGCTHHYNLHKEWFNTYKLFDSSTVILRDNHPCKVIGIGTHNFIRVI